jgi:hypothetical protein
MQYFLLERKLRIFFLNKFLQVLQYDSVYYPNCCYHLEIQWMICAGSVIKEIVSHMERQAKLCGVTMVQVPVQRDLKDRAFRAPIHISVPLEVDKHSLLHRFGFMIDNKFGSHVEYMHRTGVAFMQLVENGFVWCVGCFMFLNNHWHC